MPTNAERRASAQRELQRTIEEREKNARKRGLLLILGSGLGVVLLVVAGVLAWRTLGAGDDSSNEAASPSTEIQGDGTTLPAGRAEALPATVNCTYTPSGDASKPVEAPRSDGIDTTVQTVSMSMVTDRGPIGLTLNNAESPCTVNSFVSLASQGYFDGTTCHRLTSVPGSLEVLQCGDPSGNGTGGPGYQFADEFPRDQYADDDPALDFPVTYPRGTLAMANAGPGTNGSQFFIVYGDSQLPPRYTVFGTVDDTGLATVDAIAAAGTADGSQDGPPAEPVTITSVQLD